MKSIIISVLVGLILAVVHLSCALDVGRFELTKAEVIELSQSRYELCKQEQDLDLVCKLFLERSCSLVTSIWSQCSTIKSGPSKAPYLRLLRQLSGALSGRKWREDRANELGNFLDDCMRRLNDGRVSMNDEKELVLLPASRSSSDRVVHFHEQAAGTECRATDQVELIELRHDLRESQAANRLLSRRLEELMSASPEAQRCNCESHLNDRLAVLEGKANDWKRHAKMSDTKAETIFETHKMVVESLRQCNLERDRLRNKRGND